MGYEVAIAKAWDAFSKLNPRNELKVKFLADEYTLDFSNKKVLSPACNTIAKDFNAILLLHYLYAKLKGLAPLSGEWVDFRELSGVEGYGDAFRKRVIEPIIRKYGLRPAEILKIPERLPAKISN
jgi:hypothetical protein